MTVVRPYRPADRDALIDLLVEMERHYDGADAIGRDRVADRLDRAWATLSDTVLLVAPGDGRLDGFLTAVRTWPGTRQEIAWWVKEVYVARAARGRGVGRALMSTLLAMVETADGERVDITTDRSNAAAVGLYTALGGRLTDKVLIRYEDDAA